MHWVVILQTVMKTAKEKVLRGNRYGRSEGLDPGMPFAGREGEKYPQGGMPQSLEDYVTVVLGLGKVEKRYWLNRHERFRNDRPGF